MNIDINMVREEIFGKGTKAEIEVEKETYIAFDAHQEREIVKVSYIYDYGNFVHTWAELRVHTQDGYLYVRIVFLSKPREMCGRFLDYIRYGKLGNRKGARKITSESDNTWHHKIELGNPRCFKEVSELDEHIKLFKLIWEKA